MIHDVDESLRALVQREALNGTKVELAFDAPTRDWAARQNVPTVDLYLFDVRENLDRRQVGWKAVADQNGRTTGRRAPTRQFRLSYLVTAWTQRTEDEHRLLSTILGCFLRYEQLPKNVLAGVLAQQDDPVLVSVARPLPEDRSISDVWSALGGELKPSLDLIVTAPFDVERIRMAGPPVLEEPRLEIRRGEVSEEVGRRSRRVSTPFEEREPEQEETLYGGLPEATGAKPKRGEKPPRPGRTFRVSGTPMP